MIQTDNKNNCIAIICAMKAELDSIINILGIQTTTIINGNFTYQTANYHNKQLVFLLCGIGKVNATIHTQYIIDHKTPDLVINVGVAGGLSADLNFGDVVVATDLVYHDFDLTAFNLPLGQVSGMDVFAFPCDKKLVEIAKTTPITEYKITSGRIVTGDQFIDDINKVTMLHNQFNAIACEMEGAAVAHTCYTNKIPFVVIRALSDMAGQHGTKALHSFNELKHMAADRSSTIVKHLVQLV